VTYETIKGAPFIGSIEHIDKSAEILATIDPQTPEQLQELLITYSIPESLAWFIFQNQTFQNQPPTLFNKRHPRTVALDTRDLLGYKDGPIFDAKYHYDPWNGSNYVYIFSQPDHQIRRQFHMRIPLRNNLDLDTKQMLEAFSYIEDEQTKTPVSMRSFRTSHPYYEHEHDPSVFVESLQEAAKGFDKFLEIRDNFYNL
jgi:hypothetical protein